MFHIGLLGPNCRSLRAYFLERWLRYTGRGGSRATVYSLWRGVSIGRPVAHLRALLYTGMTLSMAGRGLVHQAGEAHKSLGSRAVVIRWRLTKKESPLFWRRREERKPRVWRPLDIISFDWGLKLRMLSRWMPRCLIVSVGRMVVPWRVTPGLLRGFFAVVEAFLG